MKEVMIPKFEAFDGKLFDSSKECLAYEAESLHMRLVGLTEAQAINAINGDDQELADILEKIGTKIRRDRQKSRNLRRSARVAKLVNPVPESAEA